VVMPVELVLPSYHVPCETPMGQVAAAYSGATALGSALAGGMLFGSFTARAPHFNSGNEAFTSVARNVWLRPSVNSARRRLAFGGKAFRPGSDENPPQMYQSP